MKANLSNFGLRRSVIVLAFLLAAFFLTRFFLIEQSQPMNVALNISKVMLQRELILDHATGAIERSVKAIQQSKVDLSAVLFSQPSLLHADYFVAVLQADELIFWNSSASFPMDLLYDSLNEGLVDDASTGNRYLHRSFHVGSWHVKLFDLVYESHPFTNKTIQQGFPKRYGSFAKLYSIASLEGATGVWVQSREGVPLFKVSKAADQMTDIPSDHAIFLFLFFLFILAWFYYTSFLVLKKWNVAYIVKYKILIFTFWVIILQFGLRVIGYKLFFVESELFHPVVFSYGNIFPSLGYLLIHLVGFLALALVISDGILKSRSSEINRSTKIQAVGYLLIIIALLFLEVFFIQMVFYQTAVPLTFSKFFIQNAFSYAVFAAAILGSLAFVVLVYGFFQNIKELPIKHIQLFLITSGILCLLTILIYIIFEKPWNIMVFVSLALSLMLLHVQTKSTGSTQIMVRLGLFLLFSGLLTTTLIRVNDVKSLQSQQLTAQQLSIDNDPLFEFMWKDTLFKIKQDSIFNGLIVSDTLSRKTMDETIVQYLNSIYLKEFKTKYDIEITVCNQQSQLLIQPLNINVNCANYFDSMVLEKGTPTATDQLYLIDDDIQGIYYIAILNMQLPNEKQQPKELQVFIEFYFKYIPEGLGYPELLIDESKGFSKDFSNYSFATYKDSTLIYKFGNYLYPTIYGQLAPNGSQVFDQSSYKHVIQASDQNKIIVVSLPLKSWATRLAPFSFFFLLLTLPYFLFFWLGIYKKNGSLFKLTFKAKLQLLIISSLLLSFVLIGMGTIYYITDVYNKKNNDFLFEKTQSILIELEHKLKNENLNRPDLREYLHQLLLKFSLVFFSDINIYGLNGELIASSRYDIFDQQLLSRQMNPQAFEALHFQEKLFFLHEENIGNSRYLSSYIPFKNEKGSVFAYINLPYFAKESEMRNEISALVLTYINLFLVISAVVILLVLLLSRKLLQPLQMIQEKMRLLRIDRVNEKIIWKSKDELGQFVAQYNTLIDELAESAERLARSERESAWRDMAKQVAHEIKNPLTPMRLSVQYLLRAWDNNDPDIANKIKLTSQTLIHQIDTLSSIAGAFSDFARMPVSTPQQINLAQWLKQLIVLFDNNTNIRFETQFEEEEQSWISADQDNMNRIFTNLIKNSLQAIGDKPDGIIRLKMKPENQQLLIELSDNGKGMNPEEAKRVFTPNFTTKSSGMGIGLAMVNNLVIQAGGTISFATEQGKGTVFYLQLPLHPSWHTTQ